MNNVIYMRKRDIKTVDMNRETIESFPDLSSLGLWAYCMTKGPAYRLNRQEICENLSIGKARYYKIMSTLRDMGLVTEYVEHSDGRLRGKSIYLKSSQDANTSEHGRGAAA